MTWQIIGDTQSVVIFRGDEPIQKDAPVEGTLEDCPPAAGEYAYTLGVAGPSEGVNYKAISVMVSDEPAPKKPLLRQRRLAPPSTSLPCCPRR